MRRRKTTFPNNKKFIFEENNQNVKDFNNVLGNATSKNAQLSLGTTEDELIPSSGGDNDQKNLGIYLLNPTAYGM